MNFSVANAVVECNSYFSRALSFNTSIIVIFLCLGLLGNVQVLYLYKYKMPQTEERFFIPHLAVADLLSCVCLAFLGITINFNYINFSHEVLCQFLHYISWVTTSWSAFILLMISISRYLKICRPNGKQMSIFAKKCAVGCCLIFSIINTLPVGYFAGYRYQDVNCLQNNITVKMCELREFEGTTHILKMVYIFFEIFVLFSNVGITGALYIPIGLQIFRRFKGRTDKKFTYQVNDVSFGKKDKKSLGNLESEVEMEVMRSENKGNEYSKTEAGLDNEIRKQAFRGPLADAGNSSQSSGKKSDVITTRKKKSSTRKKRNKNVRNNFTYMFITIIVFYILSYFPTLVTILLATDDPFHFWYSMDVVTLNVVMLMRRSSIINHIVNPIIYGYFDLTFRKAFMKSLRKMCK
ncbi:alpha-2 adrenergic receptor-like [Saccostrea echinata]|uniref:alpha-2 adrenergic receptor-like n=1 Tax=Saccostrea echinata TaxID=191078 RepID=UPI002A838B95|nr:alpha-2 adrenergic receptor-like [Saccostrea echinata]